MLELQMHEAHLLRRQKMTVSQIAGELGCSQRTIYYYLSESPRARKKRVYASKFDRFKPYIDSFETVPGLQAQVDWKDAGRRTIDGTRRKVYAFNMVLGYSRTT